MAAISADTTDVVALSAAATESALATARHSSVPKPKRATRATPAAARRAKSPEQDSRILAQPGFVLHSYPYKETSLIVDVLTRDHGRIALVAKGAKRPHSTLRGVLQTFQPLSISWSGKSEVRTLTAAEWVGGLLPLEKSALLCGFYLNELLVKLLARDDPHPALFDHYVSTLNQLAHGEFAPIVLRQFERTLLKETGVAGDWTTCTLLKKTVDPATTYVVDPEHGVRPARAADAWPKVSGKTLLDMEREDYSDPVTAAADADSDNSARSDTSLVSTISSSSTSISR